MNRTSGGVIILLVAAVLLSVAFYISHLQQGISIIWRADGERVTCYRVRMPLFDAMGFHGKRMNSAEIVKVGADPMTDRAAIYFDNAVLSLKEQNRAQIKDLDTYVQKLGAFVDRAKAGDGPHTMYYFSYGFYLTALLLLLSIIMWVMVFKKLMARPVS